MKIEEISKKLADKLETGREYKTRELLEKLQEVREAKGE